jgi:hypothetical protein
MFNYINNMFNSYFSNNYEYLNEWEQGGQWYTDKGNVTHPGLFDDGSLDNIIRDLYDLSNSNEPISVEKSAYLYPDSHKRYDIEKYDVNKIITHQYKNYVIKGTVTIATGVDNYGGEYFSTRIRKMYKVEEK